MSERSIALGGGVPSRIEERLSALGARAAVCDVLEEERVLRRAEAHASLDALVCDSLDALDQTWTLIRAVATAAMIPSSSGAIMLIAPAPDQFAHAEAARSALENLARMLSVEWSRFGITTTAISPTQSTSEDDLATLVAFSLLGLQGLLLGIPV